MKRVIGMTAAFLFIAAPVFSQNKEANGCRRIESTEKFMKDSLSLTAEQEAKIHVMHDSACARLKVVRQNTADKEAQKTASRKVMRELHDGYKSILTSGQMEILRNHRQALAKSRQGGAHKHKSIED